MNRSITKAPFVEHSLIRKISKFRKNKNKGEIKTYSRKSIILDTFINIPFKIHNGMKFIPIVIKEEMVGHKLGEFAPTRKFIKHSGKKSKK